MNASKETKETYEAKAHDYGVTTDTAMQLAAWVFKAEYPSGFLRAVLNNDLCTAFATADQSNLDALHDTVLWIYNHAPAGCHAMGGSDWTEWKGLDAMRQAQEVTPLSTDILKCLDLIGLVYNRLDIVLTLEKAMNADERTSLTHMINSLGHERAAVAVAHDLKGYKDRYDSKPGSDVWLAQSNGY